MASPKDFGWWIESTDEQTYGPVTKANLAKFLTEGVISSNTAVRHCTEPQFAPAADQGMTDGLDLSATRRTGDTLDKSWPKKTRDRMALAESDIECAYHRRPAILSCVRCLAPYCGKCQLKKGRKEYFMCKKCQSNIYNRRTGAYFFDAFLIIMIPTYAVGIPAVVMMGEAGAQILNLVSFAGTGAFLFRDAVFKGAGPGKRLFGLTVVKHEDGVTNLTYGQGFVRSLAHLIPFFNLVDASVCYADPLQRRYGDKWAKTRVIDTEAKLEKVRARAHGKLEKKGIQFNSDSLMTLPEFARLD